MPGLFFLLGLFLLQVRLVLLGYFLLVLNRRRLQEILSFPVFLDNAFPFDFFLELADSLFKIVILNLNCNHCLPH